MTNKTDTSSHPDDRDPGLLSQLKDQFGVAIIAGLGMGLIIGGLVGLVQVFLHDEFSLVGLAICLVSFAIGIPITVYAFRKSPSLRPGDPDTPRTRRMGRMMVAMILFIGMIVVPFILGLGLGEKIELYSNDPVPQWVAIYLGALFLIGMPALVYAHRRNMDEIESGEMQFGEVIGFQFFATTAPVWWIAFRGGLAPQPDIMILFVATIVVSLGANMYRKFS